MKQETHTIITYRLERAREDLEEADILLKRGHTQILLLIVFITPVFMPFLLCCLREDCPLPNTVVFGLYFTRTS